MNITEPFVLRNDVVLIPCAELREDVRTRIDYDEGDFTVSRMHGRMSSQVIDGETAALLELFRTPRTIAAAIIENSRALRKDPRSRLEELLPNLGAFMKNNVLVPVGSDEEKAIEPLLERGTRVGEWEVLNCVAMVEDSEIHRMRSVDNDDKYAALKISRSAIPFEQSLWSNEAAILRHLDGAVGPRLLDSGELDARPYLIIDWIDGVESTIGVAQRRHDRPATIELCAAVAAEYAKLHALGVIHSDVHPRNVLIRADGSVALLDFGLSRIAGRPSTVSRGGMYYFYEPEFLAGYRTGQVVPSSFAGEQYALAALLYLIVTGKHYLDFRFDRDEMARQAECDPPLPFAARGNAPWPDLEQIIVRAMEKDPARRFPSMAAMADALQAASSAARAEALAAPVADQAKELLDTLLRDFSRGGAMFASQYTDAPKASINYGAAGAAIGILRIASVRSDAALLALADVWKSRAVALIGNDDSWYNPDFELPREIIGELTPYHTESGAWAAAAMVAHARGDVFARGNALHAFLRASQRPCENPDLTLGRSATLLASAMLLEIGGDSANDLRALGNRTMESIWLELDAKPPIASCPPETYLGLAHGWCGFLYASLRWCAASDAPLPPNLAPRLRELADLGIRSGRGIAWTRTVGGHGHHDRMSGWCNGAAGYVFLWTLAHRLLGDPEWLELAELAAWQSWDEPRYTADLCCGTAGRAYALLNLYKRTGAAEWLSRARQLANHAAAAAVETSQRKNALWKGELGVATLIADLEAPEHAAMPFFEE